MWELDHKEGWASKNYAFELWCWRTLESSLDCKEIKPVNPKGNQPWMFIGSTGAEAEALILWTPDTKRWLTGKDPDAGTDWRQEEKGKTEDEMASLTRCTWVWVNSGSWWWTGRPGVLQFIGSQSQTRLSDWTGTGMDCASARKVIKIYKMSMIYEIM